MLAMHFARIVSVREKQHVQPLFSGGSYVIWCALLDTIVNFGTQIVQILLYRDFDRNKLARPDFNRHFGFQNGRQLGPVSQYFKKEDN